jgi:hypothetical protein
MKSNGLMAYPARDIAGNQNIFLMALDGSAVRKSTYGPDNALDGSDQRKLASSPVGPLPGDAA